MLLIHEAYGNYLFIDSEGECTKVFIYVIFSFIENTCREKDIKDDVRKILKGISKDFWRNI